MERLVAEGYEVLLETGGHMPIDDVPDEVVTILDVKCPGSGEAAAMHWPNLDQLSAHDEVKFVIQDRVDFDYARDVVDRYHLADRVGGRAVLAGARRAATRPSSRGGSSRIACAGPAADPGAQVHLDAGDARRVMAAPRRRAALGRSRLGDRRRARAAATAASSSR